MTDHNSTWTISLSGTFDASELKRFGSFRLRGGHRYAFMTILLIGVCLMLEKQNWHSDSQLHSNMELAAALIAAIVGVLALVRYYARSRVSYFFIGTGFLGAALLDGFHFVISQQSLIALLPSEPARLIAWSWFFSRTFLAGWLVLSLAMWKLEDPLSPGKVHLFKGMVLSEIFTISLALVLVTITGIGLIIVPPPNLTFPTYH